MANMSIARFFIAVILIAFNMKEYSTDSNAEDIVSIKDFRQTECIDLKPTKICERRKAKGVCQRNPRWAKKNCQLTCDLCTTGTTTEPTDTDCRDKLPTRKCEKMKNRGKCERKPNWAQKKCRHTCGLCTISSTTNSTSVTTITPLTTTSISSSTCEGTSFNFDEYFSWQSHMDYLECLAIRYSDNCETIDIGNSTEGRPIKVIKISSPSLDGSVKPAIWVDGGIHAREWISPSSVEYLVYQLVENFELPQNKKMVDNFDIYVLPIMNPDGYEYTRNSDRYWRKNRAINSGSSCVGVDLNRNWGYKWGGKGASTNPCSDTYRGENAFSEPETKAVEDFILNQNNNQNFTMYLTYHSYGQYVLYGWGYDEVDPPNVDQLHAMGNVAADAMRNENGGSSYSVGGAAKLLYAASGGSDDWASGSAGFEYSFTIELPPKGSPGFVLPASRILSVGKEMYAGVAAMVTKLIDDSSGK